MVGAVTVLMEGDYMQMMGSGDTPIGQIIFINFYAHHSFKNDFLRTEMHRMRREAQRGAERRRDAQGCTKMHRNASKCTESDAVQNV